MSRARSPARIRRSEESQYSIVPSQMPIGAERQELHNSAVNLVTHAFNIMLSERTEFSQQNMTIYINGYAPEIRTVLSQIPQESITVEIEDAIINLLDLYQEFITGYIDHNEYHRKYKKQMSRIRNTRGYSTVILASSLLSSTSAGVYYGIYPMYDTAVNLMTESINLSMNFLKPRSAVVGILMGSSSVNSLPEKLSLVFNVPYTAGNAFIRTVTGGLVDNAFGIMTADKIIEVLEDVKSQSFKDDSWTSASIGVLQKFTEYASTLTDHITGADITKDAVYSLIYSAMNAAERLGQLTGYLVLLIVFIGIISIIYKLSRYYYLKRKVERRKMEIIQLNFGRKSNKNKSKSRKASRKASRKTSKRKSRKTSKRKSRKTSKRKSRKASKRKSRKASKRKSRKASKLKSKSRKASRRKSRSRKASRRKSKSRKASRRKSKSRKTSKRKYTTKKVCNDFLKEKISINMGEFPTRVQAIAVSYSQTNKKFPKCSRFFKKSK